MTHQFGNLIRIDTDVHFTLNVKISALGFGATCAIIRLQMQICQTYDLKSQKHSMRVIQ